MRFFAFMAGLNVGGALYGALSHSPYAIGLGVAGAAYCLVVSGAIHNYGSKP